MTTETVTVRADDLRLLMQFCAITSLPGGGEQQMNEALARCGEALQGNAKDGTGESGMWCDTFDADLLKVVPGAAEALNALGPAGETPLRTFSRLANGKINCPSAWNTCEGLVAFFWTAPQFRPDAAYSTDAPVAECTFLEAVRDEWVHSCAISVNGHVVWRPPVRLMERLMYDLRGWTVLPDAEREDIRQSVQRSLARAALRLDRAITEAARCICGPLASRDGEDIDERPDCPVHGERRPCGCGPTEECGDCRDGEVPF